MPFLCTSTTVLVIHAYISMSTKYGAITAFSASLGIRLGVQPPAHSLVGIQTFSVAAAASMATPAYTLPIVASTAVPLTYGLPSQTGATLVPTRALSFPLASLTSQYFPLPENICAKIKNLEFVDMNELKPLAWQSNESNPIFAKKREPVTDILMWVQCFSAMAAVLAEHYLNKLLHLMAYLSTIVRCAHRYQGLNWAVYDIQFRQKAAKTKSLDWGVIDQSLYAERFTGSSNPTPYCSSCLGEHPSSTCPQGPTPYIFWNAPGQVSNIPQARQPAYTCHSQGSHTMTGTPSGTLPRDIHLTTTL